jgi:hypothetical protein
MKATLVLTGFTALLAVGAGIVRADDDDSKMQINNTDSKYDEHYQDDKGTESELHVNKEKGTSVYKDSDGVTVREKTENGKLKQEYNDGDCKQSTQKDLATGDTKVIAKGDCK